MPIENGFDRSYYLQDQGRFFNPIIHYEDDVKLPAVEKNSGYYSTTALAEHAIKVLSEHATDHAEKPFFHYLAFAAPHFPLHALPEDISIYKHRYNKGWDTLRTERWKRLQQLGVLSKTSAKTPSATERELGPPYSFPKALKTLGPSEVNKAYPWNSLTEEQKIFQSSKMEIHAAMIHRMDIEIGRVFDQIKSMGQWDNTLVMFLSDNGASAEIMVRDDGHDPKASPGSAATYLCLGPGWSTSSNTPFRRHKTWTHEGGISTPFIASWPRGIKARGEYRRTPLHVIDVVPTILELTGATKLDRAPTAPGISFSSVFEKDGNVEHESIWWFHEGHKALRMGDWKAVAFKGGNWKLYSLENDRIESIDLAKEYPEKLSNMVATQDNNVADFTELVKKDSKKK